MRLRYIMHHVMQKQAVSDVWSYFRRERMRHFRLHRKQRARADFLTAVNKWLIAHEDAEIEGAVNGLKGENITIV